MKADLQVEALGLLSLEDMLAADEGLMAREEDVEEIANAAARRIIEAGRKNREEAELKMTKPA